MESIWYAIVAFMVAAYVVLDGFDIGAGIIAPIIARSDEDRRAILRSIGPVWDGNEVWLLAAGGTLYFAFPLLYASSFSGFYLPLMMVLWLLMLRGLGVELRNHIEGQVWRGFFDFIFSMASILLAIFFGAALGNVIRGVPLRPDGYFFEALWTNWRVGPEPGILDWYTVMAGIVALVVLAQHGALYVATKTEADLNTRARKVASTLWPVVLLLTLVSLIATIYIRPEWLANYKAVPVAFVIPAVVFGSLFAILHFHAKGNEKTAFVFSGVYIAFMLVGAAVALYPNVLPASTDPSLSLTIQNTKAGEHGLRVGLIWWSIGLVIAVGYFVFVYRMFRGKVRLDEGSEHGY
jgi:cytochrome bd ubiquinol oxidase subunit II